MAEKNYEVTCNHYEDDKECLNKECCTKHCHNNKDGRCYKHCDRSWETATEDQANVLRQTHIANETLHKPIVRKL